ncbi:hypothetical protein PR048_029812 [Dryococelus australis]|uniref:Uncharacterized protein n=1 Tax=Dryococelus australis TaxID=614101 RepID=A0ABQ9G762_9NEOP|nr:hypothetical protein PR048_029812 [Dryococelus australis]
MAPDTYGDLSAPLSLPARLAAVCAAKGAYSGYWQVVIIIWEISEKTRRPAASSGTIPTCENLVEALSGIEPGRTALNPRPGNCIFARGNRAERCRWSAGFLGDIPFPPPLHSGAVPYSLLSPSSALKTSLLRTSQISSLHFLFKDANLLPKIDFACRSYYTPKPGEIEKSSVAPVQGRLGEELTWQKPTRSLCVAPAQGQPPPPLTPAKNAFSEGCSVHTAPLPLHHTEFVSQRTDPCHRSNTAKKKPVMGQTPPPPTPAKNCPSNAKCSFHVGPGRSPPPNPKALPYQGTEACFKAKTTLSLGAAADFELTWTICLPHVKWASAKFTLCAYACVCIALALVRLGRLLRQASTTPKKQTSTTTPGVHHVYYSSRSLQQPSTTTPESQVSNSAPYRWLFEHYIQMPSPSSFLQSMLECTTIVC